MKKDNKNDSLDNFVLKNYEDLDAAVKVFEMGKKLLTEKIKHKIYDALKKDRCFYDNGFDISLQGTEISWCPQDDNKIWRRKGSDNGLYFVLEITDDFSDSINLPTEDNVYLGLYYEGSGSVGKGNVKKLRSYMRKHEQVIKKEHFDILDINDDYGYIVGYVPSIEMNLSTIRDNKLQRFPNDIVGKMKILTTTLLPIIQKYEFK